MKSKGTTQLLFKIEWKRPTATLLNENWTKIAQE